MATFRGSGQLLTILRLCAISLKDARCRIIFAACAISDPKPKRKAGATPPRVVHCFESPAYAPTNINSRGVEP